MPGTILMRKPAGAAVAVLAAALALAAIATSHAGAASDCPSLPRGSDPVTLDPADFSATIDNPQRPMTVGSRWVYRVTDMADGSIKRQVITVTRKTKLIADGIRARVVRDVVRDHGRPVEGTEDWYARDPHANIWYFGEHTTARQADRQRHLAGRRQRRATRNRAPRQALRGALLPRGPRTSRPSIPTSPS